LAFYAAQAARDVELPVMMFAEGDGGGLIQNQKSWFG